MRTASRWLLVPLLPLALLFSACPAAQPDLAAETAAARPGIDATNRQLMDAFAAGNREDIGAVFTADAQLLAPGAPTRLGRDSVVEAVNALITAGIERLVLETVELEAHGDTAHEVGRYTLTSGDRTIDAGKYIVIWKHEADGVWRLHRDMFNSNGAVASEEE